MQWPMTVVLTIAMSMMILAARANGEQNDAQVNRILHQGMKLMGISALILAVNRFFIIPEVLVKELVYVDGAMRSMVLDYYRTAVWGVIPMTLTIAISAVLYGIGKPVFALCYRVVGVLAELLLFFGFAAGGFRFGGSDIQRLALVSVIGSGVIFAAALALLLLCRKNLKLDFKGFLRIHFDSIKRILLISIPVLLLLSSISARTLVYREIIPVEMGTEFYAACLMCKSVFSWTGALGQTLCMVAVIVVGHCIGAKRRDNAMAYVCRLRWIGLLSAFVLALLLVLFRYDIAGIYTDAASLKELTSTLLEIFAAGQLLLFPVCVLTGTLLSADHIWSVVIINCVSMTVSALAYRLMSQCNCMSWAAFPLLVVIDCVLCLVLMNIRYKTGRWQKMIG